MSSSDGGREDDGGDITSSKNDECISCEQNNVDNITEGIESVALLDDMSMCANCGKEGNSDDMNTCNKCKSVKYCNAACKKKHRKKHKKACEKRVAELHEEALFKEVEPEECPICLQPFPIGNHHTFESCCGKLICDGCVHAMKASEGGGDLYPCAFCRTPPASSNEEEIKRLNKLMDKGNGEAFTTLGGCYAEGYAGAYANGTMGMPQDRVKANELYLKGGELGSSSGYYNLGNAYDLGRGVERNTKKAKHYYELAAMNGSIQARHNLGCIEGQADNHQRAMRHWKIGARFGHEKCLKMVKIGLIGGMVTKDDYANCLRAYHERQNEIKSDERDKAAEYWQSVIG